MATINKNLSSHNLAKVPSAKNMNFAIIVAEWNDNITENLYKGAHDTLIACGCIADRILRVNVPGSFELPLAAQMVLDKNKNIDAVICIGSVIQGETKHFDYVCQSTALGIKDVALKYNQPIIFGVLTDNNLEQAISRSGGKHGNKGIESAISAIKMVSLKNSL